MSCRRPGFVRRASAATLLVAVLAVLVPAGPADARYDHPCWPREATPADLATRVHEMLNAHRAGAGLVPLTRHDAVADTARHWAEWLAASGTLDHDPGLAAAVASATGHRGRAGENLARAGSATRVVELFLGSGPHRDAVESSSWTTAGIGVAFAGGSAVVVVRFADVPTPDAPVPHGPAWNPDCYVLPEPGWPSAVARLYEAYLDREPDRGGLEHWVNAVLDGWALERVASAIASSSELVALTGPLDDADFVRFVYRSVLGRDPDPGGAAHWASMLASGRPRGWVMASFTQSPEYRATSAYPG